MLAAALLAQRGREVTLVEGSGQLGGLYGSVDYGAGGVFDYGMHLLYDSGVAEVDNLVAGLLPEWCVMEGNRKDVAGIYWNGRVQDYSPYLDLRHMEEEEKKACLEGIARAAVTDSGRSEHAAGYFRERFGEAVAGHLLPVVQKLFRMPAEQVSALAIRQPDMSRVLLMEAHEMDAVFADEGLRARIGYPDQLNLPVVRDFAQKARYPKQMGMGQVVRALEKRLEALGVRILRDTKVVAIQNDGARATGARLQNAAGQQEEKVVGVLWTAGLAGLHSVLMQIAPAKMAMPVAAHVHLRFQERPHMGGLYHFYVLDAGMRSFRVTDYGAYCEGAANDMGWPVCVEYWPGAEEEDDAIAQRAVGELQKFGVVPEAPTFSAVQRVVNYHRMFTVSQVRANAKLREGIKGCGLGNVFAAGVMAEGGELLLYEIARDIFAKVERL